MKGKLRKIVRKSGVAAAALLLAFALTFIPVIGTQAEAASVCIEKSSRDMICTYVPGRSSQTNWAQIYISGCTSESQIKKLKSSNKSVKVEAGPCYIRVNYANKAVKAVISCTVKGKKLKTTFTVKKYTNPMSTFKIGGKNYTSKFKSKNTYYYNSKIKFSKKKLIIKAKPGWIIQGVFVINGSSYKEYKNINKTTWTKTISLTGKGSSDWGQPESFLDVAMKKKGSNQVQWIEVAPQ